MTVVIKVISGRRATVATITILYSINDTRNNNKNVIKKRIIIIIRIKILMTIIIISV